MPFAFIGDVGGSEILVILAAILMLFGGKKLPSIARSLGRTVETLRRSADDFRDQLLNADREPDPPRTLPPRIEPAHGQKSNPPQELVEPAPPGGGSPSIGGTPDTPGRPGETPPS